MLTLDDIWEALEQEETKIPATNSLGDWCIKKNSDANLSGEGQNIRGIRRDRATARRRSILNILIPH